MKNMNSIDRFVRLLLGVISFEWAFFWLAGSGQALAYGVGALLVATAGLRFCPVYRLLGIATAGRADKAFGKVATATAAVVLLAILSGGSYASAWLSRKLFLDDFNAVNQYYKQTLFLTGKNEREKALENYVQLLPAFQAFKEKYAVYRPYALRADTQLAADLAKLSTMVTGVDTLVRSGDLQQAHLDLEKVRPVFQEIFKRNGFSMLAVALVDFHDAMELMLDAGHAKDAAKVVALYQQVSDKLRTVEAEASDPEIQAIRSNLDALLAAAQGAQGDQLPAQADILKSSFVKVYLKRG